MLSNVRKGDIVKYYSANIIKHYYTTNVYKHSVNNIKKCIKETNIPQIFPRTNRVFDNTFYQKFKNDVLCHIKLQTHFKRNLHLRSDSV